MTENRKRAVLADYKAPERMVRVVQWPGLQREVGVLRLVCSEIQAAYFAAREHFSRQRRELDAVAQRPFQDEVDYQLVALMLIDPSSRRPEDRICRNADELRRALEPDEVAWFLEQHMRMQEEQLASWRETPASDSSLRAIGAIMGCPESATADQIVARAREMLSAR